MKKSQVWCDVRCVRARVGLVSRRVRAVASCLMPDGNRSERQPLLVCCLCRGRTVAWCVCCGAGEVFW